MRMNRRVYFFLFGFTSNAVCANASTTSTRTGSPATSSGVVSASWAAILLLCLLGDPICQPTSSPTQTDSAATTLSPIITTAYPILSSSPTDIRSMVHPNTATDPQPSSSPIKLTDQYSLALNETLHDHNYFKNSSRYSIFREMFNETGEKLIFVSNLGQLNSGYYVALDAISNGLNSTLGLQPESLRKLDMKNDHRVSSISTMPGAKLFCYAPQNVAYEPLVSLNNGVGIRMNNIGTSPWKAECGDILALAYMWVQALRAGPATEHTQTHKGPLGGFYEGADLQEDSGQEGRDWIVLGQAFVSSDAERLILITWEGEGAVDDASAWDIFPPEST